MKWFIFLTVLFFAGCDDGVSTPSDPVVIPVEEFSGVRWEVWVDSDWRVTQRAEVTVYQGTVTAADYYSADGTHTKTYKRIDGQNDTVFHQTIDF